jgi:hypothetical protein
MHTMRVIERLTEKQVRNAKPPAGKRQARLSDGGCLILHVELCKNGTINRRWIFRYGFERSTHDIGLGSLDSVGLRAARDKAAELSKQKAQYIDPLAAPNEQKAERQREAQAARAEKARAKTFRQCAELFLTEHGHKWRSQKHFHQWRSSLASYVYPVIGDLNVADISKANILEVLTPIWQTRAVTARRVRGRIEQILTFAQAHDFRTGDNPAAPRSDRDSARQREDRKAALGCDALRRGSRLHA